MNKPTSTYMAYGALAAAACAWIAVGYFAVVIQNAHTEYIERMADVAAQTDQAAERARLHVLASGNLERSSKLDAIVAPDVSSIIDAIRSVGAAAGAPVKISAALPGVVPKNQKDIHAVAFVIESAGGFSSMMRVLSLFESLPVASSIEAVDLSRETEDVAPTVRASRPWRMNLKLRVLTTAAVSS